MRNFGSVTPDGRVLDTDGQEITSCIESIPDGSRAVSFHDCGRKLKGDDRYPYLCGLHVAAKDRAKSKHQQRAEAGLAADAELKAAEDRLAAINARLGIGGRVQTTLPTTGLNAFHHLPTGFAVIHMNQLEDLAARIERPEQNR